MNHAYRIFRLRPASAPNTIMQRLATQSAVGAGYNYTLSSGAASAKYNQFSLGGELSLSKRTALYALAAYQKASGTTVTADGGTTAATASIGSYGTDSGVAKQALFLVGLHHRF